MDPVCGGSTHIFVLNYNGRALLEECLPSVLEAARRAPMTCGVTVVDNNSSDGSLDNFEARWPGVGLEREPNRGLASFNAVLERRAEPIVLLLNNDVKLSPDAVGPLIDTMAQHPDALFAAPQCWTFDGLTYEGMRTRVRMRYGIVQGLCRVPGHEEVVHLPDLTAAAGPVLAVDRLKFLALGGFDPVYFPGRIEDLDLGFRGWMKGWRGYYAPQSVAYHQGAGSFGPTFGSEGCEVLALRNSLLFCWKNLAGLRLASHLGWLPVRLAYWGLRGRHVGAVFGEALSRLGPVLRARRSLGVGGPSWCRRQDEFFRQFAW
jgi:GT2 family glycosyltransferase